MGNDLVPLLEDILVDCDTLVGLLHSGTRPPTSSCDAQQKSEYLALIESNISKRQHLNEELVVQFKNLEHEISIHKSYLEAVQEVSQLRVSVTDLTKELHDTKSASDRMIEKLQLQCAEISHVKALQQQSYDAEVGRLRQEVEEERATHKIMMESKVQEWSLLHTQLQASLRQAVEERQALQEKLERERAVFQSTLASVNDRRQKVSLRDHLDSLREEVVRNKREKEALQQEVERLKRLKRPGGGGGLGA